MYRTPPRRAPRVAALAGGPRGIVALILDPWEVRAAMVTRHSLAVRNLLLRERPGLVVVASRPPAWLDALPAKVRRHEAPRYSSSLAPYPELRRFIGTAAEALVRVALTLAEDALTHPAYAIFSKN